MGFALTFIGFGLQYKKYRSLKMLEAYWGWDTFTQAFCNYGIFGSYLAVILWQLLAKLGIRLMLVETLTRVVCVL